MKRLLVLLIALSFCLPAFAGDSEKKYKVVKGAKVNEAVAATIREDEVLKHPIRISEDGKIKAKNGFTLLQSTTTSALIVVQMEEDDPGIQKVEVYRKDFGDGSYFVAMCYCRGAGDDDCKFATTAGGASNPNECGGQECCVLENVYVDEGGGRTVL
jgi:hypothetical protein